LDQSPARNTSHPLARVTQVDDVSDVDLETDMYPPVEERTHHCYALLIEPSGQIFTDLTGRFLVPSGTGSQYIFVLYDYDSNAILVEPIPNRQGATIKDAYAKLHCRLVLGNAEVRT